MNIERLENKITVDIDGTKIWFESQSEMKCTDNFALWMALPFAMQLGKNLRINGCLSSKALEQARKIVKIWSTWVPRDFADIKISSETETSQSLPLTKKSLMLFSGGVDSTFALKEEANVLGNPIDTLTIFGMDYLPSGKNNFKRLLKKTEEFTQKYSGERHVVRSNAANAMAKSGIDGSYGHGFQLLASLYLFDKIYDEGMIAADYSISQEYIVAPWGTCSLTNNMFLSDGYSIRTLSTDVTRAEKVESLALDSLALGSVSFCKDHGIRPENCGVCSKCVRTKAMFYATTGDIPDIFLIREFSEADLGTIDVSVKSEMVFANDIVQSAKKNGKLDDFRQLEANLFGKGSSKKKNKKLTVLLGQIRARKRMLLG
ncbi:MAG: hypothetical protein ACI82I_002597 [Gammaproteobacteria bacterium]